MNLTPQSLMEITADRRMFHELYDIQIVDDIYEPVNFSAVVHDKFGRHVRTIFGNVFPKVGEAFDVFSPVIVANGLMNHLYEMSVVHRSHLMTVSAFPFAGLYSHNINRFLHREIQLLSVANGMTVCDGPTAIPVRFPANAKHIALGNDLLALRDACAEAYRPQKVAQFFERWKSYIVDSRSAPKTFDELANTLEYLAALHNRSFEYHPEGVGIAFTIGGKVRVKYHKPKKSVWMETAFGGTSECDLATQGTDIVSYVTEAITGAPNNGLMGIHDSTGYAAIEGLKNRLAECPDDRLVSYVRSPSEFVVVRRDRKNHTGLLVVAKDHHDQAYLIFVVEKDGAIVRQELHTADRMEISNFYQVIAGYMEVGK